jgi:hypothetical protein
VTTEGRERSRRHTKIGLIMVPIDANIPPLRALTFRKCHVEPYLRAQTGGHKVHLFIIALDAV